MIQALSSTCPQEKGKDRTHPVSDQNEGIGFYAKVPRIVRTGYEMLSHAEKWLYVCLKDLCGEAGECWRSLRTLAKETGLSIGSLSQMIPHLAKVGLIRAAKLGTWHIKIVNIWQANLDYCSENEHAVQKMNGDSSENEQGCSDFATKESSMKNKQSSKMNNEVYVSRSYDKGYEGTPSPDATCTNETSYHIATEAIAPWLQEGHTWEEERATLIQAYEAYWEALLIHVQRPLIPSCYTEDEQRLDFSLETQNEQMHEERDLGTFFADRNGSYEMEENVEEETPVEQMSTEPVEKQASDVDNDKPNNGGVTQESEGTNGHPTALYPSGQHSNLIDHQHDSAHQDHGDTRLETATQRLEVGTGTGTPSRITTNLWQEEGHEPASEATRAVAQKDAERIADEVRAQCVAPPMVASSDAQSRQIQAPIKETVKGNGHQKDIPSRAQKVGNGGKKSAIPEPSAEAKVVIERWQAVFWQLFQKRILVNASMIEAAELLAPLDLSVEELIDLRAFGFRSNPEWYRRVGMCLMDCYKNVEKWRSLQGDTSGRASKEEDSETFYGYPIITEAWMERRRVSA